MKRAKQARKTARKAVRKTATPRRKDLGIPRWMAKGDPFEIDQKLIPVGFVYQWTEVPANRKALERLLTEGWDRVPFSRHAHDFPRGAQDANGHITIRGLTLFENTKEHHEAALARVRDFATALGGDEALKHMGPGRGGFSGGIYIMPQGWIEEEHPVDAPPSEGPDIEVAITLLMKIPARWNSAAAYLDLTLNEYTRRRILMERPTLGCLDPFAAEAVYQTVNLKISPSKEV